MQQGIRSGKLEDLLGADPQLVEAAKPDSLWPTPILAGGRRENAPWPSTLLSCEANSTLGSYALISGRKAGNNSVSL